MNLKILNWMSEIHFFNSTLECCLASKFFVKKRLIPVEVPDKKLINLGIELTPHKYVLSNRERFQ